MGGSIYTSAVPYRPLVADRGPVSGTEDHDDGGLLGTRNSHGSEEPDEKPSVC